MDTPMTPSEFLERMMRCRSGDQENDHLEMDRLMCDLLTDLGYEDGVSYFENTDKWYA